jgi:small subunit ribosomal protein S6
MFEGYYVFASFTSDPSFPAELDRVFKITDGILRSMIVNADEK